MKEINTYTILFARAIEVEAEDTSGALEELYKALEAADFGHYNFGFLIKEIRDREGNLIGGADSNSQQYQYVTNI